MTDIKRRDALKIMSGGAAILCAPSILSSCAKMTDISAAGPRKGHFENFGVTEELLRKVMNKGLEKGGDFCEVFLQHRLVHKIGMEDGEVNRAYSNVELGAGIRTVKGDSTGFAYSEDLSEKSLLKAAAVAALVADGPPKEVVTPLKTVSIKDRYRVDVPWQSVAIERRLPLVERTEEIARAYDKRITRVSVSLYDESSRIMVADSSGRMVEDDQPMTILKVACTASQNGMTEQSFRSAASRDGISFYTDERIRKVAEEAADFTVRLFDAEQPPSGNYPVVLAPALTGILLHESMGHGFEADYNRKNVSIYSEKMGKRVAKDFVTIVDDGTVGRNRGAINVDDEGAEAERTVLVENGILRSYMYDRISASHYGRELTGSGRRESFRSPPNPRMRCTYMLGGPHKPEEIIGSIKKGLYAEYFLNGQVQIGVGDFTFYLKHGRMIEDGKLTSVVKDANLIGNGPEVLETIDMVGDDLEIYDGSSTCGKDGQWVPVGFGMPTARAGAISIGGRK